MCLKFQFCTHQRVCIFHFLKKGEFVYTLMSREGCLVTTVNTTVYSLWYFYIIYLIDFPFKEMSLLFLFGKVNDIAYAISLPLIAIMCVAWIQIRKWDNPHQRTKGGGPQISSANRKSTNLQTSILLNLRLFCKCGNFLRFADPIIFAEFKLPKSAINT